MRNNNRFHLHYGDMTDSISLIKIIKEIQPDEIYNLAAQSHVHVSFDVPEFTANADGIGTLRILEAVRLCGFEKNVEYIRHQPLSYMARSKSVRKMK